MSSKILVMLHNDNAVSNISSFFNNENYDVAALTLPTNSESEIKHFQSELKQKFHVSDIPIHQDSELERIIEKYHIERAFFLSYDLSYQYIMKYAPIVLGMGARLEIGSGIISPNIALKRISKDYQAVFAKTFLKKGSFLLGLKGVVVSSPTRYSYQIAENFHLNQCDDINDYINHSCNPNAYINFDHFAMYALHDIKENEEITFNYCSSEESMISPFDCNCKSPDCYKSVRGFKYLTYQQQNLLKYLTSPYLRGKYKLSV